jgi:hypothetical protein
MNDTPRRSAIFTEIWRRPNRFAQMHWHVAALRPG